METNVCGLHIPVLVHECMRLLSPENGGKYLDGTVGLGGHSSAILERAPFCEIAALDRDPEAIARCRERFGSLGQIHFFQRNYADFAKALEALHWDHLDGVLLDLGVSSMQLDFPERGFSFHSDARLDMRMDQGEGVSAYELVNERSESELRDMIARYGEDPMAGGIARNIVLSRKKKPIGTTAELSQIVLQSYPKSWLKKSRHHPATRTFQALRIAVNDELGALHRFLESILDSLSPGGRLVIITFHSLEDRLVKQTMQRWARDCLCPGYVTQCRCHHKAEVRLVTKKPIVASEEECERNPRSTSAKVRCAEKLSQKTQNS